MSAPNELRLFISSTFRDMQEEREHLVKKIFPEIRALCRERGVTFTDVDLRWGITDEEARRGQVVRFCLNEIDRCRPFFIGILGSRYGWQPETSILELDPALVVEFPWVTDALKSGLSVTDIEFLHGALNPPDGSEVTAWFYRRDEPGAGSDAPERFTSLLNRVQSSGHPLTTYHSPEELGEEIRRDLLKEIDNTWPADQAPGDHEIQRRSHQAFARSRLRGYVPRPDYTDAVADLLGRPASPILLLRGPSGLGKSALLAKSVQEVRRVNPDALVIEYFVGAGRLSRSAFRLMQYIIHEIEERCGFGLRIPDSPEGVAREFPDWLFRAEEYSLKNGVPLLIAIDALNQLEESGQRLNWLPDPLPDTLHLLVSTTPGEIADRLSGRNARIIDVEPLSDVGMRRDIVLNYLAEFRKTIPDQLLDEITQDPKGESPLYLRMLAEQLRQHGSHETLRDEIRRYSSADDLDGAFERRLDQLEEDFGTDPVTLLFSSLHASREGLTETEIGEITGISRIVLSPLLFALDFNLLQGDGPLRFGHDFLRRAVRKQYLSREGAEEEWHCRLALYFRDQRPSERASAELAWQQQRAGDRDGLLDTLTSIDHFLLLYRPERVVEVMTYWSELRDEVDVVDAYEKGMERWSAGGEESVRELDALRNIADLLDEISEWKGSRKFSERHREKAIAVGNRLEEALALSSLALLSIHTGDLDEALELMDQGRRLYEELGDMKGVEICIGNSAQVFMRRGELDRAASALIEAGEIARVHVRPQNIVKVEGSLGVIRIMQRKYADASQHLEAAVNLARDLGDYRGLAVAVGNLGHVYMATKQPERALECFREDQSENKKVGDFVGVARATSNISMVHIEFGRYDEARAAIEESERIYRDIGDPRGVAVVLGNRGIIECGSGEYKNALKSFREQRKIHQDAGNPIGVINADEGIAMVCLECGDYELGLRTSLEAVDNARTAGDLYTLGRNLEQTAKILLEILISSEVLPDYVQVFADALEDSEQRISLLGRMEEMAREAIACLEKSSGDHLAPYGFVLLEKIICERALLTSDENLLTSAVERLREQLDRSIDDSERAEFHFGLFEIAQCRGTAAKGYDHDEALRLYTSLYQATPLFRYRKRLDRLAE